MGHQFTLYLDAKPVATSLTLDYLTSLMYTLAEAFFTYAPGVVYALPREAYIIEYNGPNGYVYTCKRLDLRARHPSYYNTRPHD